MQANIRGTVLPEHRRLSFSGSSSVVGLRLRFSGLLAPFWLVDEVNQIRYEGSFQCRGGPDLHMIV